MGLGMTRGERTANGIGVRRLMRSMRSQVAMSTAHAVVLIFGLLVVALGVYLLVSAYYPIVPTLTALVIGLILVVLGLAETLFETEYQSGRRRSD